MKEKKNDLMEKIVSKMRINCELVIMQPDIGILSHHLFREEIDTETLNNVLFKNGAIKSASLAQEVESLMPQNIEVTNKHFDVATANIVIKARRIE